MLERGAGECRLGSGCKRPAASVARENNPRDANARKRRRAKSSYSLRLFPAFIRCSALAPAFGFPPATHARRSLAAGYF